MKQMRFLMTVALLAAFTVTTGWAAAAKSEVGVIEWEKVLQGYEAYQAAAKQHSEFTAQRQQVLTDMFATRMLSEAEAKEYAELKKLAAPTEAQTARLNELAGLSDKLERELEALKPLAQPTPEQEKRRNELSAVQEANRKKIEETQAKLKQEVTDELNRLMGPLDERLKKAISEVAQENKLTVVLEKGNVLFGGEDITDKVLAKVNKK